MPSFNQMTSNKCLSSNKRLECFWAFIGICSLPVFIQDGVVDFAFILQEVSQNLENTRRVQQFDCFSLLLQRPCHAGYRLQFPNEVLLQTTLYTWCSAKIISSLSHLWFKWAGPKCSACALLATISTIIEKKHLELFINIFRALLKSTIILATNVQVFV